MPVKLTPSQGEPGKQDAELIAVKVAETSLILLN
jgi:hypothetical protein